MIDRIQWRLLGSERPPFDHEGRELRVTVHAPLCDSLSTDERFLLGLLRELTQNKLLDVADTDSSAPRRLEIGSEPNERGLVQVTIIEGDEPRRFMGMYPEDWADSAITLIGVGNDSDQRVRDLAIHLPVLEAHDQNRRDIFATTVCAKRNAETTSALCVRR